MYSIVEIKGKQYRVEPNLEIQVDKIEEKEGAAVKDIKVLLHKGENGAVQVGKPHLANVSVSAKVLGDVRGEKVKSVRYKPKAGYTKTHGHRQTYTRLKIESISAK